MQPDLTDMKKMLLGLFGYRQSPYNDPRIKAYFIKDLTPLIMRTYALPGVDYEKVIAGFTINRLKLAEVSTPTDDQKAKAKVIHYYEDLRW